MVVTKKDKVKNMFRDANGWKTGIRNGLTLLQILYKLGPLPLPTLRIELREEKSRLRSILMLVKKDLEKEGVFLFFLPFNKKQTRIVFIPETREVRRRRDHSSLKWKRQGQGHCRGRGDKKNDKG